nr:hypothetical protein [Kocuria indica]
MPRRPDHDVVLVYVSRSRESCIFHDEILELADQFPGLRPVFWFTEERGCLDASDADALAELCPDHADRVTYASGPDSFVSAVEDLSRSHGGPPWWNASMSPGSSAAANAGKFGSPVPR